MFEPVINGISPFSKTISFPISIPRIIVEISFINTVLSVIFDKILNSSLKSEKLHSSFTLASFTAIKTAVGIFTFSKTSSPTNFKLIGLVWVSMKVLKFTNFIPFR